MGEAERALADSLIAKLQHRPFMLSPMVSAFPADRNRLREAIGEWLRDIASGKIHPGAMWNS